MVRRIFGKAGDRLIIEERLDGQETSILALTDGRTIVPLVTSQDHKRAHDGDEGPNTGGMGAYSPAEIVTPEIMAVVEREVLVPVVHALKRARRPFKGVLYAGLMLTNQGPKVLEFNVRFGDPECQAILMRLKSDLFDALEAVVDGTLDEVALVWDARPAVTVVMASEGYPGAYERAKTINGLDEADRIDGVKVFHAGTALRSDPTLGRDGRVVTDGGRVLGVTAIGDTLLDARNRAYEATRAIRYAGAWFRHDIAGRALKTADLRARGGSPFVISSAPALEDRGHRQPRRFETTKAPLRRSKEGSGERSDPRSIQVGSGDLVARSLGVELAVDAPGRPEESRGG